MKGGAGLAKVFAGKNQLNFQLYLYSLNPYAVEESKDGLTFFFYKQDLPVGLGQDVLLHDFGERFEKTKYFWVVRVKVLNQPMAPKRARYLHILKGGAFGTGEHDTTKACISLLINLRKNLSKINSVLDFGAGTGILGLIAEKLFRCAVFFSEIDPVAIFNLEQNIKLNRSRGKLKNLTDLFTAELILANVYSQTLINCANILVQKKPAWVIASGFKKIDEIKFFLANFDIITQVKVGSWLAVLLKAVK